MDGMSEADKSGDWRTWDYGAWNDRLLRYCLTSEFTRQTSRVERIPATPEELAHAVGAAAEEGQEVAGAFLSAVRAGLPVGLGFCGFCNDKRGWTVDAPGAPHFFGMLWATCLIAYGYPATEGSYHERAVAALGKSTQEWCLPGLWEEVAAWTRSKAKTLEPRRRYRELLLPERDDYRRNIGYSWFLAFPHRDDRRRLRRLLEAHGLAGEEPPVALVLEKLLENERSFSSHFREDLASFRRRFGVRDAQNSPFWRAVRQEALAEPDRTSEIRKHEPRSMAFIDRYGRPVAYVGCTSATPLPPEARMQELPTPVGSVTHYVEVGEGDGASTEAFRAYASGHFGSGTGFRYLKRGVVVFQEEIAGEYVGVGGAEADGATLAMVRHDRSSAFLTAYGGEPSEGTLPGWNFVVGCAVVVRGGPAPGLEDVSHLHPTTFPPTIRFVGGIVAAGGYLADPDFLPRVRFRNATTVRATSESGRVVHGTRDPSEPTLWTLPKSVVSDDTRMWTVEVEWRDADGSPRRNHTRVGFVEAALRYDYRAPASGRFWAEGSRTADVEHVGGRPLEDCLTDPSNAAQERTDLLWSQQDFRYLGPGLGEMWGEATAGYDWLSLGPANAPTALAFVGDIRAPFPPSGLGTDDKSARRHWRKALNVDRIGVVVNGTTASLTGFPEVMRSLRAYRRAANGSSPPRGPLPLAGRRPLRDSVQGIPSHPALASLVDAVAAISVRRAGLAREEFLRMVALALGMDRTADRTLTFDIARSWAEAGAVDILFGQGRRGPLVVARRPRLIAFRVGGFVRASLVGLVPKTLMLRVASEVAAHGVRAQLGSSTSPWTPPKMRFEASDSGALAELSRHLDLEPLSWLKVPTGEGAPFGLDPWNTKFREDRPPGYPPRASWDFAAGRMGPHDPRARSGTYLELRGPIYVVGVDGQDWCWTFSRAWALLFAYVLRDDRLPFVVQEDRGLQSLHPGIHLPLAAARYLGVLSTVGSGPVPTFGPRTTYRYPLAAFLLTELFPGLRFHPATEVRSADQGGIPCKIP